MLSFFSWFFFRLIVVFIFVVRLQCAIQLSRCSVKDRSIMWDSGVMVCLFTLTVKMHSVCLLLYFLAFWAPSNQSLFSLLSISFHSSSFIISQSMSELLSLVSLRALHKNSQFWEMNFPKFSFLRCSLANRSGSRGVRIPIPWGFGSQGTESTWKFISVHFWSHWTFCRDFSFILRQVTMGSWIPCSWE